MTRTLVVVPSVPAVFEGEQTFLDLKAVDGLIAYARLWPGPVRALMRQGKRSHIAFGKSFGPGDLPFEVRMIATDPASDPAAFDDAAIILAAGDSHHDFTLAGQVAAPLVYIIEYTLDTRLRINRLANGRSLQTVKSAIWTLKIERQRRRAFRQAAGLQCNGTPAFDAYRTITPAPLLYFDTRTADAQQITPEALTAKRAAMLEGQPLRLAFSGRLERMKGADHLVPVAAALAQRGIAFTLDIYGDGDARGEIVRQIAAASLADRVMLHGPVAFAEMLIPAMIDRTDLFLCCHRQGDPSCTYMETLSCGVPIVGYDNAAFRGIVALGDVGTAVAMDSINAAADAIAALASDRAALAAKATNAAEVGRAHSFEREFERRIMHLRGIAGM